MSQGTPNMNTDIEKILNTKYYSDKKT